MAWIIVKSCRDSNTPYEGPSCKEAGVKPGKIYSDRKEAMQDAAKLTLYNPVGFVVKEYQECITQ